MKFGVWRLEFGVVLRNSKLLTPNFLSPDGGIGRRARLKIWLSQGSAGSIPVLGTKPNGRKTYSYNSCGFFIVHKGTV